MKTRHEGVEVCCCSVTKSYLTLCDPMDCITPGTSVFQPPPLSVLVSPSVMFNSLQPHGLKPHQASLSITNSQSLLKLMSIELVMPSNHPILFCPPPPPPAFSSCLQSFPASGSFPMSQFFASGGQSIEVSASTSVLPMSIQD